MAWMCQLIWIYTVYPCNKGVSMKKKGEEIYYNLTIGVLLTGFFFFT
jgi:hypothetical protein